MLFGKTLQICIFVSMNKQVIIDSIRADKLFLEKEFSVEEIALFGSYTHDTQTEDSDIDFLVSLNEPSYSKLMGLYIYLEKKFNTKVDIVRKGSHLSLRFFNRISKDLIYV